MSLTSSKVESSQAPLDLVVVDDDSLTLEIVSWICRGTSTRFLLFPEPEAAMEYLSDNLPATLIVDFYMPQQNGLEFLVDLSKRCELEASAVFVCSAVRPPQPQIEILDSLGVRILDKSLLCDRQSLLALVESGV